MCRSIMRCLDLSREICLSFFYLGPVQLYFDRKRLFKKGFLISTVHRENYFSRLNESALACLKYKNQLS